MAELVDAAASKAAGFRFVRVRVPFRPMGSLVWILRNFYSLSF